MVEKINIGNRDYGYKNILEYKQVLIEHGVPEERLKLDRSKLNHYYKLASKALVCLEVAFLSLGVDATLAAPQTGIDISPIEDFSNEIWATMLKAILYLSLPCYAWVGYVFAFAGQNSGKRTVAKVIFFSIVGGTVFVAAAPWASNQVYNIARRVFHV
jgi:hypothetical protein